MAVLEQFEKVPVKQRLMVLGIVVALVLAGFWYFVWAPKTKKIRIAQTQYQNLANEVQTLQTIEAQNKEFQQENAELRVQLDAARQQLPGQREIERILELFAGFGHQVGVEIAAFRPQSEISRGFYNEVPMSLSLRGPFHSVALFLDRISHYPRIISVSSLSLGGATEKEGALLLNATCTATTYRYVESK